MSNKQNDVYYENLEELKSEHQKPLNSTFNVLIFYNDQCKIEKFDDRKSADFYAKFIYPYIYQNFKKCIVAEIPAEPEPVKTFNGRIVLPTMEQINQHERDFINSFCNY